MYRNPRFYHWTILDESAEGICLLVSPRTLLLSLFFRLENRTKLQLQCSVLRHAHSRAVEFVDLRYT